MAILKFLNENHEWEQVDVVSDGVTFIPSISEDGTLSWSNNGSLQNPDPVMLDSNSVVIRDTKEEFPVDGNINLLYLERTNNDFYRWDSISRKYIKISSGGGGSVDISGKPGNILTYDEDNKLYVPKEEIEISEDEGNAIESRENGLYVSISDSAEEITYDNTTSELEAINVQDAIDELVDKISQGSGGSADDKMDKVNPTGTGSFSLNRKAGSKVGSNSFSEGNNCEASGENSHAEGSGTHATAYEAHAEGNSTWATKSGAHAEGNSSFATGLYCHAEGQGTHAEGDYSHAEGSGTYAKGNSAHSEGVSTYANADYTHAEGHSTYAKKMYSHAEGLGTIANALYQHTQGRYNIEDTEDKYAHIVGNGTISERSNAHTLDWDGNAWYSGKVSADGGFNLSSDDVTNALGYTPATKGVDYTSEEQVIGTWFGKPLYQKTITFTTPETGAGTYGQLLGIFDVDMYMIDIPHSFMVGKQLNIKRPNVHLKAGWSMTEAQQLMSNLDIYQITGELKLDYRINADTNYNGNTIYLTVQYTKTTD